MCLAALGLLACGDDDEVASQPTTSTSPPVTAAAAGARADLVDAQGRSVGQVTFTERGTQIVVDGSVTGLPPGFHGFHIHATGKCEPPFTTAGGHMVVSDQSHPAHAGDQPVLMVFADGSAESRFKTDRYRMSDLLTADGPCRHRARRRRQLRERPDSLRPSR